MLSTSDIPTHPSLLQRAQAGNDSPAWEEVLQYYEPFVRQTLVRLRIEKSDVDDVCQQVLTKLWTGLKNYRRDEKQARFRTWLTVLIRSVVIDHYRRQKRLKTHEVLAFDAVAKTLAKPCQIEEMIEAEWQKYVISLAMKRIKKIFTGKAIEVFVRIKKGESFDEVSKRMNITKQSAYVLKSRVSKSLIYEVVQIRKNLEAPNDQS